MSFLKSLIAISVLSASSVSAATFVEGKAPLSIGVNAAKKEAVKQALVDASYRKNSYVSSTTKIDRLEVAESASVIKTSSLIENYSIHEEGECGSFYCVTLKVEYGEKPSTGDEVDGLSYFVEFESDKSLKQGEASLLDALSKDTLKSLAGLDGVKVVNEPLMADFKVKVVVDFKKADQGVLGFLLTPKKEAVATILVSNFSGDVQKEVSVSNYLNETSGEELYEASDALKAAILAASDSLPSENNFVVSTIEADRLFIKSTEQVVGSLYEVVFHDLRTGLDVSMGGTVISVYRDDVIIQLDTVPHSAFRLKRLSKLVK